MTKLYLIRHAHSQEWQQATARAPLTPFGRRQAELLANRLKHDPITIIYTSSYYRSRETAEIIAKPHHTRVQTEKELLEVDYRIKRRISLAKFSELQNFYTQSEIDQINNLLKAQRKAVRFVKDLLRHHPNRHVMIVTHGNIIKTIILGVLELRLSRFQRFVIDECSLTTIEGTYFEDATIRVMNDTTHLAGLRWPKAK